jgi:hypothetical protein
VAYDHLRRLDNERIRMLHELIAENEHKLVMLYEDKENYEATSYDLVRAKDHLSKILGESVSETEERYAAIHESMLSEHDLGLADLDFSRTGI